MVLHNAQPQAVRHRDTETQRHTETHRDTQRQKTETERDTETQRHRETQSDGDIGKAVWHAGTERRCLASACGRRPPESKPGCAAAGLE